MENFVLYDELGKANEQIIYKARRKGTIKYLAICCTDRHRRPLISNHVRFVHVLSHPNVLQFHEWYETSNHLWLVMELCTGGSLEQVIKEDGYLPVNVVRKFGSDIVRGLQYIHSRGVVFNDTNPSRFLLDGHGNVKLFDFSLAHLENESLDEVLSRFSDEDEFHQHTNGYEYNRISSYTAPERLKGSTVTTASDYWGLGCLLYHMSCGSAPFTGDTVEQLTDNIINQETPLLTIPGKKPSCALLALINSLLTKSSSKRITQSLLIRHEFWQNGLKDLEMPSTGETEETSLSIQDKNLENNHNVKCMNGTDESLDLEPQLDLPNVNEDVLSTDGLKENRLDHLSVGGASTGPQSDTANFTLHTNATGIIPVSPRNVNGLNLHPEHEQSEQIGQEEEDEDENWIPDRRMVQSEYNGLQSGSNVDSTSGDGSSLRVPGTTTDLVYDVTTSVAQTIGENKFAPQPVPVEVRANLALTYPWGDESPTLPHEPKLMLSLWNYLRGSFEDTAKASIVNNRSASAGTPIGLITGWRPRPLIDYTRWTRASPTSRIEALSNIWDETKLRDAGVLVVFRSQGSESIETSSSRTGSRTPGCRGPTVQKLARAHLLAYLIWLSATATASISRTPIGNLRDEHLQLIGSAVFPELFIECVRQLKSSPSTPVELRIGLCQLCSLLMHRIATVVFYYISNKAGSQLQRLGWKPVASNLPVCLSALVDILREPVARTGHRLRQIGLAALGETLTCAVCLLANSIQEAEVTGVCEGLLTEIQSSQWQTVVHHLLRCLTPAPTGSIQVPPSPGVDTPSPLDNVDLIGSETRTSGGGIGQAGAGVNETSTDNPTSTNTATTATVRVSEAHVRLSAARALDAFVTSILGCRLHDISVTGSLLASATACSQAITTTDVVRHLWTSGVIEVGSTRQTTGLLQRNQLNQEISLACANSLAGIIRINPSLFTTGLVDRIGLNSFVNVVEPPAGGPACQQTSLVVRLLSMACSGLLIPLSSRSSSGSSSTNRGKRASLGTTTILIHGRQSVTNTGGAGTAAACRRILTDQRFMVGVFRHLKSPHAMLRAKSYLLCSAILATCPKDSFPLAFDANLPAILERDLKTTRGLQHRYLDVQSTTSIVTSNTDVTGSPGMMYLAACSLHFTDLLVLHLIPLICQQLLIALGCLPPSPSASTRQTNARGTGANSTARRLSRPHSMIGTTRTPSLSQASSTSALNSTGLGCNLTTARAWLPAFSCLTGVLNACPTIRSRLLQPQSQGFNGSREQIDSTESDFSLLAVLGRLLGLWASVDPISSSSIAGLHQPGTIENQLLSVTLTIVEDLSQHSELVEAMRRDFICLILPGLARVAVAPGARPETRAICVKVSSQNVFGQSVSESLGQIIS
ncbi:Serine/threonine-protein kinase ULK4 [Fasciolopsis buskii]|uniref:Serine/threonine-protein kinase ULK4 n=1 Tax=Fasciolopsis buskii TaxID=27845 RepID=A0A8E0VNN7_9TREM|nr:Serine/threonine-protein kinase ULK4 [Fasciolopsis buski]